MSREMLASAVDDKEEEVKGGMGSERWGCDARDATDGVTRAGIRTYHRCEVIGVVLETRNDRLDV